MARHDKETLARLRSLINELVSTGEAEQINAAEVILRALLRGALQLQHSKRFPGLTAEAISDAIRKAKRKEKDKS